MAMPSGIAFLLVIPDGQLSGVHLDAGARQPSGKQSYRLAVRNNPPFLSTCSCRLFPDGCPIGTVFLTVFQDFLTVSGRQENLQSGSEYTQHPDKTLATYV
jgi:hypothetical protein